MKLLTMMAAALVLCFPQLGFASNNSVENKIEVRRGHKCFARYDGRRQSRVFEARASERHIARRRAMRKCRNNVRRPGRCYIDRCKRSGWEIDF